MQVTLIANVTHYHELARALAESNLLKCYITSFGPTAVDHIPAFLPAGMRKKMEERCLSGIPINKTKRLLIPELIQRLLPITPIVTSQCANRIHNGMFDRRASAHLAGDVLHYLYPVAANTAREARKRGMKTVCDLREAHPAVQRDIEVQEAERLGIDVPSFATRDCDVLNEQLDQADAVVVPSTFVRETLVRGKVQVSKVFTVPYGVDTRLFFPRRSCVDKPPFQAVYAGRISAAKGIGVLLEAWKRLSLPASSLLLVGSIQHGFRSVLDRYSGHFTYHPPVPRRQLPDFYTAASLFVMPSLSDGFPLAVIEAMAAGLAVIISDSTGTKDIITNRREGLIVGAGDIESWERAILELYTNSSLREYMGCRASSTANCCSWERYRERMKEFYTGFAGSVDHPAPEELCTNGAVAK